MEIGLVGLGRMGANIARRLMRGGHSVVAFDVNADAVTGELIGEMGVDDFDVVAGEESATDAGLVGDDEELVAGVLQALEGGVDAGDDDYALQFADVVGVFHQDAVAIQKHRAMGWRCRFHVGGIVCRNGRPARGSSRAGRKEPGETR